MSATDDGQLVLRPDQPDWECELWARQAVRLVLHGETPSLPILMPPGAADAIWEVATELVAELLNPETTQ